MCKMKYRPIDGIEKRASVLVYGTGNEKIMGADSGLARECLDMAWENGFTPPQYDLQAKPLAASG